MARIYCGFDHCTQYSIAHQGKFIETHIVKQWQIVFNRNIIQLTNIPGFRIMHLALSDFAVSRLGTKKVY